MLHVVGPAPQRLNVGKVRGRRHAVRIFEIELAEGDDMVNLPLVGQLAVVVPIHPRLPLGLDEGAQLSRGAAEKRPYHIEIALGEHRIPRGIVDPYGLPIARLARMPGPIPLALQWAVGQVTFVAHGVRGQAQSNVTAAAGLPGEVEPVPRGAGSFQRLDLEILFHGCDS